MTYAVSKERAEREAANFNRINGNEVTRYVVAEVHSPLFAKQLGEQWGVVRQIRWAHEPREQWRNDGWVNLSG